MNCSGCVDSGTLYADGSAMMTSSTCEYCFCLKGKQTCVKPRCAEPELEGCTPRFRDLACCPTHYDCGKHLLLLLLLFSSTFNLKNGLFFVLFLAKELYVAFPCCQLFNCLTERNVRVKLPCFFFRFFPVIIFVLLFMFVYY